jgi:hypothetical protein
MALEEKSGDKLSQDPKGARASVESSLNGTHRDIFNRAISNVLSTDIAEITYAQIIDGLPLADVVQDTANGGLPDAHPIHDAHSELCPGVLEKARAYREAFEPGTLHLDASVRNTRKVLSLGASLTFHFVAHRRLPRCVAWIEGFQDTPG